MGQATNIQWCDTTVNPNTGCDGCELWELTAGHVRPEAAGGLMRSCYAGNLHEGRLSKSLPDLYAPDFAEVRMVPGRMKKAAAFSDLRGVPRHGKPWIPPETPRLIFVGDMGDVFSKAVTFEFLKEELIGVADSKAGRRHVWMVLTKRPGRFAEFAEWAGGLPENVWAGTSITGKATRGRINQLIEVPASTLFLSVEPLIEGISLTSECPIPATGDRPDRVGYTAGRDDGKGSLARTGPEALGRTKIRLVITGGESSHRGHRARPFDLAWARSLRDQCRAAGVAIFLKQLGSSPFDSKGRVDVGGPDSHAVALDLRDSHGGDWSEWPEDLRIREFPTPHAIGA